MIKILNDHIEKDGVAYVLRQYPQHIFHNIKGSWIAEWCGGEIGK